MPCSTVRQRNCCPTAVFETDLFCTQAETHANAENSLILAVVDNTAPVLRSADSTSSTAQGGGGSFKKRKTIGEIGCCESRMSKQKH